MIFWSLFVKVHYWFLKAVQSKKPVNPKIYGLLVLFDNRFVESGRVELPSKQATKKLSTRLFPDWIFDSELGQEQPLFA